MKKHIALTFLLLTIAHHVQAIELPVPSLETQAAAQPVKPNPKAPVQPALTNTLNRHFYDQDLKLQGLMSLNDQAFKLRMDDVNDLLQAYDFSTRSIRERDGQIRRYLSLAARAIRIDDQNISIEYVYNAFREFKTDFNRIMLEISLNAGRNETLSPRDIQDVQCNLRNMQIARREGQDHERALNCPIPKK